MNTTIHNIRTQFGWRDFENAFDNLNYFPELFGNGFGNFVSSYFHSFRITGSEVSSFYVYFFFFIYFHCASDGNFKKFGGSFADCQTMFLFYIFNDYLIKLVSTDSDRSPSYNTAKRNDSYFSGASTDI